MLGPKRMQRAGVKAGSSVKDIVELGWGRDGSTSRGEAHRIERCWWSIVSFDGYSVLGHQVYVCVCM